MNKFYYNGVIYSTDREYIRIDISDSIGFTEEEDILKVTYTVDSLSEDSPFTVVRTGIKQTSLSPTKLKFTTYSLDGLLISPFIPKYRITQVITYGLEMVTHYDERSLTIFVNPTYPKDQYLQKLSEVHLIQVDLNSNFEYKNYNNVMLDQKLEITSSSDVVISPKSQFTKYIFNEPHMVYQLNQHLFTQLMQYNILNIEKTGDPDEDMKINSDVFTYRIGNESMEKIRIHPNSYLNRSIAVTLPMEYQIKTQSLSVALDIRNKFMNLELLSDITSLEVQDVYGHPMRINIWWDPQMSDLGDRESTIDEYGNYTHLLTIRCTVNYFILRDEDELTRIHKVRGVFNLIDELTRSGVKVSYSKDTKTGEKVLSALTPLAEWEIDKLLNK